MRSLAVSEASGSAVGGLGSNLTTAPTLALRRCLKQSRASSRRASPRAVESAEGNLAWVRFPPPPSHLASIGARGSARRSPPCRSPNVMRSWEAMQEGASRPRDVVRRERSRIVAFLTERGARDVRVFGSVARGEDDDRSDIDLLVELEGERSRVRDIPRPARGGGSASSRRVLGFRVVGELRLLPPPFRRGGTL